jgi:hypothetical protein
MYFKGSILILVLFLCIVIVMLIKKEKFKATTCGFYYKHTLDEDSRIYIKYLVSLALKDMNTKGFQYVPHELEKVIIRNSENNGFIDYKIYYFVNSLTHYSNRKLLFNLSVHEQNSILIINSITDGESLYPILPRHKHSERGSLLYKPKETYVPASKESETELDFDKSNVKETDPVSLFDRHKGLELDESLLIGNQFPIRKIIPKWDTYGISIVDNRKEQCNGGISRVVRDEDMKPITSNNPTLFYRKDDTFNKLFSLTEDAASRPIGVG